MGKERRGYRKILRGIPVGLVGAALAAALWLPGKLERLEAPTWDLRARAFMRPGTGTPHVALILLDVASLEWGEEQMGWSWPWPRETYAAVADFCARGGARTLVLDVGFPVPSSYGVSDDESLAEAAARNGRVVGAVFSNEGRRSSWPDGVPEPRMRIDGLDKWMAAAKPTGIVNSVAAFPIPEFATAVRVLATTNQDQDSDGVFRRVRLFNVFDGRVLPCEGLAAYLAGDPRDHPLALQQGMMSVDGRRMPIDSDGKSILRFRGPSLTHSSFSMAAVIQSELRIREGGTPPIDPAELRDKYVFLGFTAGGLFDLKPTPMPGPYSGVEINATMLDNLLSDDFIRDVPLWAGLVLLVVLCVAAGISISSVSKVGWSVPVYVLFLLAGPALSVAGYAAGYWVQVVALIAGLLLTLVGGSLLNFATEGKQKRFIKSAFKQYLSPAFIDQLLEHPERLTLGGERREISMFFSDLEGFTSLSESLDPAELTSLINDYLTPMTDIIQEGEGGTLDKYVGDAIVAFWNAPLAQPDHALRAVRAALLCQRKLAQLRPAFRARCGYDLLMRVGLNTGMATVANMGSRSRFSYTMMGDQVNLAARLEGNNKLFHTYTMVAEPTVKAMAGAFPVRELSRITVKGKREPVTVYEPMLPEEYEARKAALAVFAEGLALYYEGRFAEAAAAFARIAAEDRAAGVYAKRCAELAAHRPEGEWNGVWVMTEK